MAPGHPVTLHVGTPKSGTTFLQRALSQHRELLAEQGYLYPGSNPSHFIEAMSLRDRGFRGHQYDAAEGAWDRLVEQVLAFDGPALVSHEMIGGADREAIDRAVGSFPGREVRVVITCRDLGRQVPAVWQEGIKNGDTAPYEEFLASSFDGWKGTRSRRGIWSGQNIAGIAARWGEAVGDERVVLVTVPPPGAGTDDLWNRFSEAVGLPGADYTLRDQPGNPSLGTVETELLRRLVRRLPEDLSWGDHSRQVKRRFAQQRLVQHHTGGSLTIPQEFRARTEGVAEEMLAAVRAAGHPVVGDLADLTPTYRPGGTLPDEVPDAVLLELALDLLVPGVLADGPARRRQPSPAPPAAAPLRARVRRWLGRRG